MSIINMYLQVAFEKVGAVSTQTITKQWKKEQPAVQPEFIVLNPSKKLLSSQESELTD